MASDENDKLSNDEVKELFESLKGKSENEDNKANIKRSEIRKKYYEDFKPNHNIYKEKTVDNTFFIEMYKEYIQKLEEFIVECEYIRLKKPEEKNIFDYKFNYRQKGSRERILHEYKKHGEDEPHRFIHAYTELMVDFVWYSEDFPDDEFKEIELITMKLLAEYLIDKAEKNIQDIEKH